MSDLRERVARAWVALRALDTPEEAEMVAKAVLRSAGYPLPTFMNPMPEARYWASLASLNERKAYALASYEALPASEQAAFLDHVQGERRAAA